MAIYTQNVLSLCSGVGGLELGLHLARPDLRTVCYVEREAYAASVLVARMEEGWLDQAPIWSDLLTFDGKPWRGVVDAVIGGFPCQPWSVAGKQRGTADERWIWGDIRRIVEEVDPDWCFFENVPGLVRGGLPIVLQDLDTLRFDAEWAVFPASEVGAPHQRKRLYILAHSRRQRRQQDTRSAPANEAADGRTGWDIRQPDGHHELGSQGPSVADADAHGWQQQRRGSVHDGQRQALGNDADGRSSQAAAVGDTSRVGWREGRTEHELWSGRDTVAEPGRVVGYSDRAGLEGRQRSEFGSADQWTVGATGSPLADAASLLRQQEQWSSPYRDVGSFPPRPDDVQLWSGVQEILEPAVCRVAYGMADRVDRLRACGNGVVPLAAANAYRTLADRLGI